jgi:hypothetical protein
MSEITGMHGRRSPGKLDEQTRPGGVSDRCQICRNVQAISTSALRPCASARAHFRPGWQYINVPRFFVIVKESIDEGTQWVVFEPQYEPLQTRVGRAMTQDDIENGWLMWWSESPPAAPANFVIFRIQ